MAPETRDRLAPLLAGLAALVMVLAYAWVCDDAFITFRVVDQVLAGNGPVFNAGERVQAFTHPLWLVLLLVGGAVGMPLYYWAIALGLACSFATFHLLGRLLPPRILLVVCAVLLTSPAFLEFQTSGLENPLTHLLIAAMLSVAATRGAAGAPALVLLAALLLLNRLDLAPLVGPLLAILAVRRPISLLGLLPLVLWLAFATLYYGSPLPNTAYAKVAFSVPVALAHGFSYVADFVTHEPLQSLAFAAALAVLAGAGGLDADSGRPAQVAARAVAAGVVLEVLAVVWVGGDFMRGRMLLAPLFAAVTTAGVALRHRAQEAPPALVAGTVLACALALQSNVAFLAVPTITPSGVTRERAQYPTLWLGHYAGDGFEEGRGVTGVRLRRYAERYGPIAVSADVLGVLGYKAGPQVTVLDHFTLADAYAARLDPVQRNLRAGHIRRHVPEEYYRLRGDLSLLKDWEERLATFDPTLAHDAAEAAAQAAWRDPGAKALYDMTTEVVSGPVFARLGLLPGFASPRSWRRSLVEVERARVGDARVFANYIPGFGDFRTLLEGEPSDAEVTAWDDPRYAVPIYKPGDRVIVDLGGERSIYMLTLIADANDTYRVTFSTDGARFGEPWAAPPESGVGLKPRSTPGGFQRRARYLCLEVVSGDGFYSLGRLDVGAER